MERYDYASRTARLRNRIAISYPQNSKHESLPTGSLFGLCLSYHASSTPPKVVSVVPVVFVVLKPQPTEANGLIRAIRFICVL